MAQRLVWSGKPLNKSKGSASKAYVREHIFTLAHANRRSWAKRVGCNVSVCASGAAR